MGLFRKLLISRDFHAQQSVECQKNPVRGSSLGRITFLREVTGKWQVTQITTPYNRGEQKRMSNISRLQQEKETSGYISPIPKKEIKTDCSDLQIM